MLVPFLPREAADSDSALQLIVLEVRLVSHGLLFCRGQFDKRPVAVKRILPECFEMADHEVFVLT